MLCFIWQLFLIAIVQVFILSCSCSVRAVTVLFLQQHLQQFSKPFCVPQEHVYFKIPALFLSALHSVI